MDFLRPIKGKDLSPINMDLYSKEVKNVISITICDFYRELETDMEKLDEQDYAVLVMKLTLLSIFAIEQVSDDHYDESSKIRAVTDLKNNYQKIRRMYEPSLEQTCEIMMICKNFDEVNKNV